MKKTLTLIAIAAGLLFPAKANTENAVDRFYCLFNKTEICAKYDFSNYIFDGFFGAAAASAGIPAGKQGAPAQGASTVTDIKYPSIMAIDPEGRCGLDPTTTKIIGSNPSPGLTWLMVNTTKWCPEAGIDAPIYIPLG